MQNLIRPLASLFTLGVFLLIALATGGSTNTTVQPTTCKPINPPVDANLSVVIKFDFENEANVVAAKGDLFLTRQVIEDTVNCVSVIADQLRIPFTTDTDGRFTYGGLPYTNYNEGDLWRVEVNIPAKPGVYEGVREVKVAAGDTHSVTFELISPLPL